MKRAWLALSLLAMVPWAHACKCLSMTLTEHLRRADVAFVGVLVGAMPNEGHPSVTMRVLRSLKDAPAAGGSVEIQSAFGTDCEMPLVPGADLLVFAYRDAAGELHTHACDGTRLAGPAVIGGKEVAAPADVVLFLQSLK